MTSSPMNLSTTPCSASTTLASRSMHSLRSAITACGSMPSVSEVKPRMSANKTVISRFSPPSSTSPFISSSAMSLDTTLLSTERYCSRTSRPRVISLNAPASLPISSLESIETSAW